MRCGLVQSPPAKSAKRESHHQAASTLLTRSAGRPSLASATMSFLAWYVQSINQLQSSVDLEPVLQFFGSPNRKIERELGFEALDLRLTALIAIAVYTVPGILMVVSGAKRLLSVSLATDNCPACRFITAQSSTIPLVACGLLFRHFRGVRRQLICNGGVRARKSPLTELPSFDSRYPFAAPDHRQQEADGEQSEGGQLVDPSGPPHESPRCVDAHVLRSHRDFRSEHAQVCL